MGILKEQDSLTTWMKREKGILFKAGFVLSSFTWQASGGVSRRRVKYESDQRTPVFPPLKLCDNDFVALHLHHCGHRPHKEKESDGGPGTDSQ